MILQHLAKESIREQASRLGFAMVGITRVTEAPDYQRFCDWLDRGYAGSMDYLVKRREAYRHPKSVLEDCQSLILLALPYAPHPRTSKRKSTSTISTALNAADSGRGTIGAYAAGPIDYHDIIRKRLNELIDALKTMFPSARSRGIVDTAPLLERNFAQLSGLGWIGKNTLLLNRELGSYFFLAAILTQATLDSDPPLTVDHCGTCQACLNACPTQAFVEPRVLDATRCISYWTIEHRGSIPEAIRPSIGDWIFGCDACQTVCPWNRKTDVSIEESLVPSDWDEKCDCLFWLSIDNATFRERFRLTPFWRSGLAGMQRNAMIVAANLRCKEAISPLMDFLDSEDPTLRETARWSLEQLQQAV